MTEPTTSAPDSDGVVPGRKAGNLLGLRDVSSSGRSGGCGCGGHAGRGRGRGAGSGGCGASPQVGAGGDAQTA